MVCCGFRGAPSNRPAPSGQRALEEFVGFGGDRPAEGTHGVSSRGDGLQKSGHILYTKGCARTVPSDRYPTRGVRDGIDHAPDPESETRQLLT